MSGIRGLDRGVGSARRMAFILVPLVVIGLLVGGYFLVRSLIGSPFQAAPPETIARASLQSMQEQARLVTFQARYVAVVTSTQRRFGLSAQKTLIMPGSVRYEVNLAALRQEHVRWDAATRTLSVTLPPIEVSEPQIDLSAIQEYSGGGVLMALTGAEDTLDQANREAGQRSLLDQARQATPMRLARESAKRSIASSFALPLRAAGVDATVEVRFADEPADEERTYVDRSRTMEEVLNEVRAKEGR